ncbi:MAG TPA: hypothetical protein VIG24_12600 [Acidimicrobiia bacterium]
MYEGTTFNCTACDYRTDDAYTVEVIDALEGTCPVCITDVTAEMFTFSEVMA